MDETDMQLLSAVQDGFPITPRPFFDLGRALGLPEAEVIERLAGLQKEGLVRRIGPILDLRKLGRQRNFGGPEGAPGRGRWGSEGRQ